MTGEDGHGKEAREEVAKVWAPVPFAVGYTFVQIVDRVQDKISSNILSILNITVMGEHGRED